MNRLQAVSSRRWQILALIASLLLNAFLVGMLLTDTLRHTKRSDGPRVINWELRRLAGRLPPEALEQITRDLAPVADGFDSRFKELRARREAIRGLAAQPNPDRQVIDRQLAEMRAEAERLQADLQAATYDALLRLPPETRAELAVPPGDR